MDETNLMTFGDLRYRQLQRILKMSLPKTKDKTPVNDSTFSPVPWPSVSSIAMDSLDTSCAAPSLHTSVSEVVASSNHFRNMILKQRGRQPNSKTMTTSSVKKYAVEQTDSLDSSVMPPPKSTSVPRRSKQSSIDVPLHNRSITDEDVASNNIANTSEASPVPTMIANENKNFQDTAYCLSVVNNNQKHAPRVFYKWRVMLNEQAQLVIKGRLESGRVARSKPVIRRHEPLIVESLYKHTYHLNGNIVDDRNELPDYVRGKFWNGFPDDWENVYQIWRTFVTQGCKLTFRWPTPITDSDDDIKSEITDVTVLHTRNSNRQDSNMRLSTKLDNDWDIEHNKSKNRTLPSNVKVSNDISDRSCNSNTTLKENCTEQRRKCCHCHTTKLSDSFTQTAESPGLDQSFRHDLRISKCDTTFTSDKENTQPNRNAMRDNPSIHNVSAKPSKLNDIIREDKLNMIIDNLANKNCSQEYIDKIIEMFDCLNYVVSHSPLEKQDVALKSCLDQKAVHSDISLLESVDALETASESTDGVVKVNKDRQRKGGVRSQQHVHDNNKAYITDAINPHVPENQTCKSYESDDTETESNIQKCNIIQGRRDGSAILDRSESEIYAGVPKISVEHILHSKHTFRKACKRKGKTKMPSPTRAKCKTVKPQSPKELQNVRRGHELQSNIEDKVTVPEDSSISITEEELDEDENLEKVDNLKRNGVLGQRALMSNKVHSATSTETNTEYVNKETANIKETNRCQLINVNGKHNFQKAEDPGERHKNSCTPSKSCNAASSKKSIPNIISSVQANVNINSLTKNSNFLCDNTSTLDDIGTALAGQVKEQINQEKYTQKQLNCVKQRNVNNDVKENKIDKTQSNFVKNPEENAELLMSNDNSSSSKAKPFGSKENPKMLTAWVPKVVCDLNSNSKLGLLFEGKLLNESGHVLHRKFKTDVILRRISAALIETVNHEVYQLLGNMIQHYTVPKELLKYCRNGCPAKIDQFCKMWQLLEEETTKRSGEDSRNTTVDISTVSVSSRGRKILPPLNYWTGERVTLKDNTCVYTPGNNQDSSISSYESLDKLDTKINKSNRKAVDTSNERTDSTRKKLQNTKSQSTVKVKTLSANKASESRITKTQALEEIRSSTNRRQSHLTCKRRLAEQLRSTSDTSSDTDADKQDSTDANVQVRHSEHNQIQHSDTHLQTEYTTKLRKRQKMESSSNIPSHLSAVQTRNSLCQQSPLKVTYGKMQTRL